MSSHKHSTPDLPRKTYQVVPGPQMGLISPEKLANIAQVALKHSIPLIKITSAQRLSFVGYNPANLQAIWHDLGYEQSPQKSGGVHYVQACPGVRHCKYGRQDSLRLGEELQDKLLTLDLPAKTKVGISGCSMNCCECFVRDLGIFGKKDGWTLTFGGNGGGRPRIGDIIGADLADSQVIDLAIKCLTYYRKLARPKERTARFMERIKLADFKNGVAS